MQSQRLPNRICIFVALLALSACTPASALTATQSPASTHTPAASPTATRTPRPSPTPLPDFIVPEDLQDLPPFSAASIEGIFEVASLDIGVDIGDFAFAPVEGGWSLWVATWEQDSRLEHWDLYAARAVREMAVGDIFAPRSLAASPDGRLLVTADEDDVQLWDAATGAALPFDFVPSPWLEEAALPPKGERLLAVGYTSVDGTLALIDPDSGEDLAVFRHGDYVTDIDFSSDGRYLASGSANGTVKVIDVAGLHETFAYEESGWVDSVALEGSPPAAGARGHLLAISTGGAISLWDGGTGELHSVLGGHGSEVDSMDFSPNGELLASGGRDGELKIWDVSTGEELAAFFLEGGIRRVLFSRDGSLLAASTLQGPIRVWALDE
ncbi:MAG: hypothetical protein DWG76_07355 [Chloroflexi bacterium]|nr:hypothetical protein [Chloroflexota bacterium]